MAGSQDLREEAGAVVYCVVPRELAPKLHHKLGRFLDEEPDVRLIVERRGGERRRSRDRRGTGDPAAAPAVERRRIRSDLGRRCGDRRASQVPVRPRPLPRSVKRFADRIGFVEPLEPADHVREQVEAARLVTRIQGGEMQAFATLYERYFDQLYRYLCLALRTRDEAEDATQQVFLNVLEALPTYEQRRRPFRAWLFRIARNHAIDRLRERGRVDLEEPGRMELLENASGAAMGTPLRWLSDQDVLAFIERLPLPQRQVVVLRYMLDLTTAEIAQVLERTPQSVRQLQSRALRRLERQVGKLGVQRDGGQSKPMRLPLTQVVASRAAFGHGFSLAGAGRV